MLPSRADLVRVVLMYGEDALGPTATAFGYARETPLRSSAPDQPPALTSPHRPPARIARENQPVAEYFPASTEIRWLPRQQNPDKVAALLSSPLTAEELRH